MLLTTCWILNAFVIMISYGDLIPSTDLPVLKPNSWPGIAVDTATLVVRLVMRLRFPGHWITIGFSTSPAYSESFESYVCWPRVWYADYSTVALCCVVASSCGQVWNLEKLYKRLFEN